VPALAGEIRRGLSFFVLYRRIGAMLQQQLEALAIAGERDRMQRRRARLARRARLRAFVQQHPHDLDDVTRARVGRDGRMQRREAALARSGPRVGARIEQVADDLASLEEGGKPERRVPIRRHRVRLRRVAFDDLANPGNLAGGGRLEEGEQRSSPEYCRRDVVVTVVERGQDGGESLLVARVDEGSVPLQEPFDRRLIAASYRREELRPHLGLPTSLVSG